MSSWMSASLYGSCTLYGSHCFGLKKVRLDRAGYVEPHGDQNGEEEPLLTHAVSPQPEMHQAAGEQVELFIGVKYLSGRNRVASH